MRSIEQVFQPSGADQYSEFLLYSPDAGNPFDVIPFLFAHPDEDYVSQITANVYVEKSVDGTIFVPAFELDSTLQAGIPQIKFGGDYGRPGYPVFFRVRVRQFDTGTIAVKLGY